MRGRWTTGWGSELNPSLVAIVAAAVVVALAIPGLAGRAGPPARAQNPEPTSPELGRRLYLRDCSSCHGPRAEGTFRGPSLERAGAASVDFMLSTGRMPIDDPDEPVTGGEPAYDAAAIAALVAYLDTLVEGPSVPQVPAGVGDLSEGGERYRLLCAPCHGATGVGGGLAYANPAPNLSASTAVQTAEAMLVGPGTMPVFAPDPLTSRELASIARYVDYLHDPATPGGLSFGVGPVVEGLVAWVLLGALVVVTRMMGAPR